MSAFLAVLSRELRAYFYSPMAYVILACIQAYNGATFSYIVWVLSGPGAGGSATPLRIFFAPHFFFWLFLFVVVAVLTMRLIAEELRSGTIEPLMTSPVSEAQVVLGKYVAAFVFFLFLWAPTLVFVLIMGRWSEVDWGPIASGYLGIVGIGAVFMAVGIFGSSLSKSQIVAAILTFAMLTFFFFVSIAHDLATDETAKEVINHMNLMQHMDDFGKGIVDTRRLVYYVSTSALFLFFTSLALAAKKWR